MIASKRHGSGATRWLRGLSLLYAAAVLPLGLSLAQDSVDAPSPSVSVSADRYEYGGRTLQTIGDLARALDDDSVDVEVMECGADGRVLELLDLLRERKQTTVAVRGVSPEDCG